MINKNRILMVMAMGMLLMPEFAAAQSGVRTYVVRRLYEAGAVQQYNVVFNLKGDVKSSELDIEMPLSVESQLRIDTKILKVESNGQARLQYTYKYLKNVVDLLSEEDLPKPTTETIRISPSGFPVEDEAQKKVVSRTKGASNGDDNFPGIPFLPDAQLFLTQIGFDLIPGPFYPVPPRPMTEGDQWRFEVPTPFINTQGGRLTLDHATAHTYPVVVKVIGLKEMQGRPCLHLQQTTDATLNIPIGDTLLEVVRLLDRNPPKGTLKGTLKGTIDYYLALSDGALVQASGNIKQDLRVEYDAQTIRQWAPDESWAEWNAQASFKQTLASAKAATPTAPAKKPAPKKPAPAKKPAPKKK